MCTRGGAVQQYYNNIVLRENGKTKRSVHTNTPIRLRPVAAAAPGEGLIITINVHVNLPLPTLCTRNGVASVYVYIYTIAHKSRKRKQRVNTNRSIGDLVEYGFDEESNRRKPRTNRRHGSVGRLDEWTAFAIFYPVGFCGRCGGAMTVVWPEKSATNTSHTLETNSRSFCF